MQPVMLIAQGVEVLNAGSAQACQAKLGEGPPNP